MQVDSVDHVLVRRMVRAGAPLLATLCLGVWIAATSTAGPRGMPEAGQATSGERRADVVVALGVRPVGQFTPSPGMMSNLLTAIGLLERNQAQRLMVCGGHTRGHIAEAEMMAVIAQGLGVSLDKILVENGSVDTEENAHNAGILAGRNDMKSAILVAQKDHVQRASRLFREAGAFKSLIPVVGESFVPDFPIAAASEADTSGKFDAIVVHGVSPGYDFSQNELAVDPGLVRMLSMASGFYRQGTSAKVVLWHPFSPMGHIKRTEVMAILLAAMGVPERDMVLGSSRRYEADMQRIPRLCELAGARSVLALVPPDDIMRQARWNGRKKERDLGGPGSAVEAVEMYRKAGIRAKVVTVDML